MLLPQKKEREYRFKLALRMGLPIFALIIALVTHTFIENSATLQTPFYIESIILLVFSIYFFLYLIYNGFDVKIIDSVSKTFTREYLYDYIKKEIKNKKEYTLILISIDNLSDINTLYGIKNGDRALEEVAKWIVEYFTIHKIDNFPLGHIKGGDFVLGLEGKKSEYSAILDLMCLKANELKVDNIEIKLSGAISDTAYSKDLGYIIENLFELQEEKRDFKKQVENENINPNELESYVINAIDTRRIIITTQDVIKDGKSAFKECFIKLKTQTGKPLYYNSYIKIINKLGLSIEYDLMVLEELLLHTEKQDNTVYALNISPTSLRNEIFLAKTKELLKDTNITIMFVLNEQEYYSHISRYNTIINSLKSLGVKIAIDKIGSMHTSFLYLRELDIDLIRFDTYYSNSKRLEKNSAIIHGFKVMAEEKSIQTWIKNVEDETTFSLIQSLNIDYIQGKLLSNLEVIYEKQI